MDSIFSPYRSLGTMKHLDDQENIDPDTSPLDQERAPATPNLLLVVIGLTWLVLIGRLFHLQIVKGSSNFFLAEGNRIRQLSLPAPRGIIFDQSGKSLVENIVQYSLAVIPTDLPIEATTRQSIYDRIVPKLSDDERTTLSETFSNRLLSVNPVEIIPRIPHDQAVMWQVELVDTPGIVILKRPERRYVPIASVGHIIGYLGKIDEQTLKQYPEYSLQDNIGKTGLEAAYESTLKGIPGAQQFEVDAKGALIRTLASISPRQGISIRLALHQGLQQATYQAFEEQPEVPIKATAIAINPKNGGILAMISTPDFNPNTFIEANKEEVEKILNDSDQPLVNRAIAGRYLPGSTIKPLYALAALQEKVVSPNFSVDTPSEITIGQFRFPDWKDHGSTDIRRAIAESNNIFFYAITGGWGPIKGLGIDRIEKYLRSYNFGEKSGLDLPGEVTGFVPSPGWKQRKRGERWYIGDTYHLGIGQGDISVTPLQLLVAQSAIFNGGKLMKPYLVEALLDVDGQTTRPTQPKIIRQLAVDARWLQVVKEGMRMTITEGSGRSLNDIKDKNGQPVEVAGKTGTAQFGNEGKTHAWFVGFAPWNDPEIGVVVLIEGGGEGHAVAAPVAKKMFEYWFNK